MAGGKREPIAACPESVDSYNAAMLDIKLLRENAEKVRERLATRGAGDEARGLMSC